MSDITADRRLMHLVFTEAKVRTRLKQLNGVLSPKHKKSCCCLRG